MKTPRAKAIPEFNAQILDTIVNTHGLPLQDADEFTIADLRARGWTRDMARSYVEKECCFNRATRRMGRARRTNRVCWLYRKVEGA